MPTESKLFTCPDCGGAEFQLIYRRPLSPEELADATAALLIFASDSPIYAHCSWGCDFDTSVTNIELSMTPRRA